jgi:alkyldihydroxyacetonephosphate synthase
MIRDRSKLRWNGWGWIAQRDRLAAHDAFWTWLAQELGMPGLLATPPRPLEELVLPASRLTAGERAVLIALLGADRVREGAHERAFHARGRSYRDLLGLRAGDLDLVPDAVLYPRGQGEVLAVLMLANEAGIAVVPFGGGTGVAGATLADPCGFKSVLALDLTGMDRVIEIDTVGGTATLQAGISGMALEQALKARGATLGHYPQSFEFSTLGGWIAHRGAGQMLPRYGTAENWLLSARLATPRGLFSTEAVPASATGPRLSQLIVGSEGAFGVITDATVRIRSAPAFADYRGYLFRDFASGAAAIRTVMQNEIPAAMLVLSDAQETRFCRAFNALSDRQGWSDRLADARREFNGFDDAACALVTGFEGTRTEIRESVGRVAAIARRLGAIPLGRSPGERWRAGRFRTPGLRDSMLDRGVGIDTFETAASWSRLDALHASVCQALTAALRANALKPDADGIVLARIAHAYRDGASLEFSVIFPRRLDGEIEQWQAIKTAACDAIVAHGGTISHHHGIGTEHLRWMEMEKGALGLEVLRAIKQVFDPKGILNPGKLIPR